MSLEVDDPHRSLNFPLVGRRVRVEPRYDLRQVKLLAGSFNGRGKLLKLYVASFFVQGQTADRGPERAKRVNTVR